MQQASSSRENFPGVIAPARCHLVIAICSKVGGHAFHASCSTQIPKHNFSTTAVHITISMYNNGYSWTLVETDIYRWLLVIVGRH